MLPRQTKRTDISGEKGWEAEGEDFGSVMTLPDLGIIEVRERDKAMLVLTDK
jgi:hypothetical protein